MSRETFTIETVETKASSRGPFKRAKLSGIGYVTVFANGDQDFLEENVGQQASAEIEIANAEKGWKNASAFQKASGTPSQAAGSDAMSKSEWDEKEDRAHIRALYAAHKSGMIEYYSSQPGGAGWVASGITSYKDLCVRARQAAVEDRDWLRNYATGDVPFG